MSLKNHIDRIVDALKADAKRDLYEANYPRDEYWITYQGGGPFPGDVVKQMVASGLLVRKYPDCECYTLAPTRKRIQSSLKCSSE